MVRLPSGTPRISVIFSSLRPEKIEWNLDKLECFQDQIEVIVASPFPLRPRPFLKWVSVPGDFDGGNFHDRELRGELSLSEKYNLSLLHSSGEYIVFNNDDLEIEGTWVTTLLDHMDQMTSLYSPYLCCFTNSYQTRIIPNYSIFGQLYAHQGCISRTDLVKVGGFLYDSRMRTEYVDPDLSLRVWEAGGLVSVFDKINVKTDAYSKRHKLHAVTDPICSPYKTYWAKIDANQFFDKWSYKIDFKFLHNFRSMSGRFDDDDGVIPANKMPMVRDNYLFICHFLFLIGKFCLGNDSAFVIGLKIKIIRSLNRRLKRESSDSRPLVDRLS